MIAEVAACNTNMAVLHAFCDNSNSYDAPGLPASSLRRNVVLFTNKPVWILCTEKPTLWTSYEKKIGGKIFKKKIQGGQCPKIYGEDNVRKIGWGG